MGGVDAGEGLLNGGWILVDPLGDGEVVVRADVVPEHRGGEAVPGRAYQPPGSRAMACRNRCSASPNSPLRRAIVPPRRPGSALSGLGSAALARSRRALAGLRCATPLAVETSRTERYGKPSATAAARTPATPRTAPAVTQRRRWGVAPGSSAGRVTVVRASAIATPRNPSAGPLRAGISQNQSTDPWISPPVTGEQRRLPPWLAGNSRSERRASAQRAAIAATTGTSRTAPGPTKPVCASRRSSRLCVQAGSSVVRRCERGSVWAKLSWPSPPSGMGEGGFQRHPPEVVAAAPNGPRNGTPSEAAVDRRMAEAAPLLGEEMDGVAVRRRGRADRPDRDRGGGNHGADLQATPPRQTTRADERLRPREHRPDTMSRRRSSRGDTAGVGRRPRLGRRGRRARCRPRAADGLG